MREISKKIEKPLYTVRKVCYTMLMVEQNNQNTLTGRRKEMKESMTAEEAARLAEWLKAYGAKYADVVSCMNYLAKREPLPKKKKSKKKKKD